MIKNKEQLIESKSQLINQKVTDYINEMDALSNTEQFTIDRIEQIWEQLNSDTKTICAEINAEMIRQLNEKELIRKKKRNTPPKESS